MKKGFLIGGGLIFAGLMLEMSIGPVVWDSFAWPVNGIVLAGFLAMIAGMFLLRKKVYAFSFIGTYQAAIPTLVYAVLLTIIMGLTRQKPGGTWLNSMLTFWPFVLIYVYMAVILGEVVLKRFSKLRSGCSIRDIAFLLNHLGLFITMTAATLGNADMQRLKMVTNVGVPEWCAVTQEGLIREMPMTIELKKFILETYDDGLPEQASPTPQLLPKRFASEIQVLTKSGKTIYATVDVNKPVEVDGWKIYQYGYDTQMGAMSQTSILELVSDPWLPLVYAGIYMMLVGAVSIIVYTRWNYKWMLLFATVLALVIISVYLFMPVMHSKTLMPALQSPWFIPHVMVYMFAYAVFGVATVMSIFLLIKKSRSHQEISLASIDNLVYVGLVFMTIGMLFGALWAKEAWGHYWSWDPKETWAAITWFSYLVFVHYRRLPKQKPCLALCLLILSFVLLQMCWWGINYLPSAQGTSVHTYN